jgi:xylan 1,4-beta-xylosidase
MLQGQNPVLRGFHPDPCLIRVEDDYYLATSTFQWFGGVQLYHSKDLVHWEQLPSPLSRVSQLDLRGAPNSGGVWAPCLSYSDGVFYLIYTSVRNFHGIYKDTPNYLVTTTDIRGEWSEPIYLNSSGFDPSLFHDDDGRKYLVNMRWDHRSEHHAFEGIMIQEYSPEEKRLIGKAVNIYKGTGFGATEAPHLYKKDGYYYLMVAEGGTMYHHGVQMARSKSLYGPYESDSQPVIATRDCPEPIQQRTGHGSLINTLDGRHYVAYLCGRPITDKRRCILGRETCIAEVVWNEDGWLRLKEGGVLPPDTYQSYLPEVTYPPIPDEEQFNSTTLPPHFKTLRLPLSEMGSLTDRPGYLRLYGHEAITSLNRQSLVARRLDAFDATATVKMEFAPTDFQQMAGLTVFYDTFNFFYLYLSAADNGGNELRIQVRDNLRFYEPMSGGVSVGDATTLWLRVEIHGLTLAFSYSLDGERFTPIGGILDGTNLSDEAYFDIGHEGHTGTFIGMACQDLSGCNLHADFDSFTYLRQE